MKNRYQNYERYVGFEAKNTRKTRNNMKTINMREAKEISKGVEITLKEFAILRTQQKFYDTPYEAMRKVNEIIRRLEKEYNLPYTRPNEE
jgi:hypothetical protein